MINVATSIYEERERKKIVMLKERRVKVNDNIQRAWHIIYY